jgi:ribonuclease P protein component
MIGRIVRPADFQRVLAAPLRSRSTHFAVHFLADRPGLSSAAQTARQLRQTPCAQAADVAPALAATQDLAELSTKLSTACALPEIGMAAPVDEWWLGLVVPKRHAKRAVTRNLIKRQVRALMATHCAAAMPAGLWVVRLRAPFDRQEFLSPASDVLRATAHAELAALLERAVHSPLPARAPRAAGAASSRAKR